MEEKRAKRVLWSKGQGLEVDFLPFAHTPLAKTQSRGTKQPQGRLGNVVFLKKRLCCDEHTADQSQARA